MIALDLEVIARLKVQPEAIAGAEVAGEPKGRIGGDGAGPVDDLVDAAGRDADVVGQTVLETPSGSRKSAARTSPGWIGASYGLP